MPPSCGHLRDPGGWSDEIRRISRDAEQTENLAKIISFSCSPDADNTTSQEDKDILGNPSAEPGISVAAQSPQLSRVDGGPEQKRFSEEEKRTIGSTPLSVFTTYLTNGKQLPLWILALLVYIAYTSLIFVRVSRPLY